MRWLEFADSLDYETTFLCLCAVKVDCGPANSHGWRLRGWLALATHHALDMLMGSEEKTCKTCRKILRQHYMQCVWNSEWISGFMLNCSDNAWCTENCSLAGRRLNLSFGVFLICKLRGTSFGTFLLFIILFRTQFN